MFRKANVYCSVVLVTVALFAIISCAPSSQGLGAEAAPAGRSFAADQSAGSPPSSPSTPVLEVEPGTTRIMVNWEPVVDATSYKVQWRLRSEKFAGDANQTVTESDAEIDLPGKVTGLCVSRRATSMVVVVPRSPRLTSSSTYLATRRSGSGTLTKDWRLTGTPFRASTSSSIALVPTTRGGVNRMCWRHRGTPLDTKSSMTSRVSGTRWSASSLTAMTKAAVALTWAGAEHFHARALAVHRSVAAG